MVDEKKLDTVWLGSLVHSRVQGGSMDMDAAVADVAEWINENGKLRDVWRDSSSRILRGAFRDYVRVHLGETSRGGETLRDGVGTLKRRRDYRAEILKNPDLLWQMPVCIGGGREHKALGEWTQADTLRHAKYYFGIRDTLNFRGELWGRVARAQGDLTLHAAFEGGALSDDLVVFVQFRGQIDGEALELLAQDCAEGVGATVAT